MDKKGQFYCCILHPKIQSVYLESIEHHCKYKEPDLHRQEILSKLLFKSKSTASARKVLPNRYPQNCFEDDCDDYQYYYYYQLGI